MTALPRPIVDFLRASKLKSQTEILKNFVRLVIRNNQIAREGSIHIFNPTTSQLEIFNPDNFLYDEGLLKRDKRLFNLTPGQGGAGRAFSLRTPKLIDPRTDSTFISEAGGDNISSIICVPIYTDRDGPIGVASFHDPPGERRLTETDLEVIVTYVDVLGSALLASPKKMDVNSPRTVFIVHGHDKLALTELENITLKLGIRSYILQNEPGYGMTLIEILEKKIGGDPAVAFGIVLMTADDMVFTNKETGKTIFRPRQNVLIEAGMLFANIGREKVALLIKDDIEVPSDLSGILYLGFKHNVKEVVSKLVPHLKQAGFPIT